MRDILAWTEFINSCPDNLNPMAALYHGASMVFIDALGTNNTAYLAENESRLHIIKQECVTKLSLFADYDLTEFLNNQFQVSIGLHDLYFLYLYWKVQNITSLSIWKLQPLLQMP